MVNRRGAQNEVVRKNDGDVRAVYGSAMIADCTALYLYLCKGKKSLK